MCASVSNIDYRIAEWSFQYLRRHAQIAREELVKHRVERSYNLETTNPRSQAYPGKNTDPIVESGAVDEEPEVVLEGIYSENEDSQGVDSRMGILDGKDVISFRAQWNYNIGRLIVHSNGIRFERSLSNKELWNRPFVDLVEMRKLQGLTVSKLIMKALGQLEFTCTDGAILRIEAMKDRDEAFNTIIGFSGLQWQVLQRGPGEHGDGGNSGNNS